ncbi:MAG: hypothetical protein AAF401_13725, partial [Pseudomonadota bacterium]
MLVYKGLTDQNADALGDSGVGLSAEAARTAAERVESEAALAAQRASQAVSSNLNRNLNGLAWRLGALMALVDLLAITAAFAAAIGLAGLTRSVLGFDPAPAEIFLAARGDELALIIPLALVVFAFGGLYRRGGWELGEIRTIAFALGLVALLDATL